MFNNQFNQLSQMFNKINQMTEQMKQMEESNRQMLHELEQREAFAVQQIQNLQHMLRDSQTQMQNMVSSYQTQFNQSNLSAGNNYNYQQRNQTGISMQTPSLNTNQSFANLATMDPSTYESAMRRLNN